MSEQRIIDLETRLTFQENTIQELNEIVTQQQMQIERLSRSLNLVKAQLLEAMPSLIASHSEETPPPHY